MSKLKRYDIKKLLANPDLRRHLIVESTVVTQAREGIEVTHEQAEDSYYVVTEGERAAFFGLVPFRTEAEDNDDRHVEFARTFGNVSSTTRIDVALRDFTSIGGAPLAFDKVGHIGKFFRENAALEPTFGYARLGAHTSEDERMLRCWWEVNGMTAKQGKEYIPFAKGGAYCRFYFDIYLRVAWDPARRSFFGWYGRQGRETERPEALDDYFKPGLFWPRRTQRGFNVRVLPAGCIFADKGPAVFLKSEQATWFMLGCLNSHLVEGVLKALTSFGSWEVGAVKKVPIPKAAAADQKVVGDLARKLHDAKAGWDTGNEICTRFERPWLLQRSANGNAASISAALDQVLTRERALDDELAAHYASLNDTGYRLYGVNDALRAKLEAAIGERPPEVVWPQMDGQSAEQKRMEHVFRLLSYTVKCVVEEDGDGLVSLQSVAQELSLLERVRAKLASFFPEQDPHTLEIEIVNELKKRVKGYARAESLQEWLTDRFFDFHCDLYQQRPILWHLASSQDSAEPAFSVVAHYHRFDHDLLAKLRSVHVRDRMAILRREAAQAGKGGRGDDRLQLLGALEEVEAFDRKLARLQEGHHEGAEGDEADYRILTPWKKPQDRPKGWQPDIDDGVKVNIAPLARTGLLRNKNKFGAKEVDE